MVFCTACGKENDDNAKYCLKCGHAISEETKETVNYSINLDTNNKNSENKKNWIKRIAQFSIIWGAIYLLIAPLFSVALALFVILLYVTKNVETIYYFGVIWFLSGLTQVVIGMSITTLLGQGLIILGIINFVLGVWIILHNKKVVVSSNSV